MPVVAAALLELLDAHPVFCGQVAEAVGQEAALGDVPAELWPHAVKPTRQRVKAALRPLACVQQVHRHVRAKVGRERPEEHVVSAIRRGSCQGLAAALVPEAKACSALLQLSKRYKVVH